MSVGPLNWGVAGLGSFSGKPAMAQPDWSPRTAGIQREIEAELKRQGFAPNILEHGQSFDTAALALAIDRKLHG